VLEWFVPFRFCLLYRADHDNKQLEPRDPVHRSISVPSGTAPTLVTLAFVNGHACLHEIFTVPRHTHYETYTTVPTHAKPLHYSQPSAEEMYYIAPPSLPNFSLRRHHHRQHTFTSIQYNGNNRSLWYEALVRKQLYSTSASNQDGEHDQSPHAKHRRHGHCSNYV
jgi:hypothetical protein